MWPTAEIERVCDLLLAQMGKPYAIGGIVDGKWVVRGKPGVDTADPVDFDCSGLVAWGIAQGRDEDGRRIILPQGTYNQVKVCRPVGLPLPLDLGFADLHPPGGVVDHVVIKISDTLVIEARSTPYNKVITRPIAAWDKQKGFLGWWRPPGIRDNERMPALREAV